MNTDGNVVREVSLHDTSNRRSLDEVGTRSS
jgi:hypothetical protein